jgi:AAA+ ATPase superfamily predicted ATPase
MVRSVKISRVVGAPAIGNAFFDRKELVKRICDRLKCGSILLVAPRRFGKTSIMLKAEENLASDDVLPLYLDVEWVSQPSDFVTEVLYKLKETSNSGFTVLLKNLPAGLFSFIKNNIDNLEIAGFRLKLRDELREAWVEKGREIFKAFKTIKADVILFVDEFPLMLYNMSSRAKIDSAEIHSFLYWLRSIRMETNVRMVFGGSIGIDQILKTINAGASINDMERIFVGPFEKKDAKALIALLFESENVKIDEKSIDKILDVLEEPIPYFIQIMVSTLLNEAKTSKLKVTPTMVETAYQNRVLGVECRSYFEHYFQRLSIYYSPQEAEVAKKLLKEIALKEKMSQKELFKSYCVCAQNDDVEKFNYIINELENDFYLKFDPITSEYKFATNVLRDLWLRRYEVLE